MLNVPQILVSTRWRRLALAGAAALVAGCGQKGPLYLPTDAAAAQRATLPQTLAPVPAAAASAPSGTASPAPRP